MSWLGNVGRWFGQWFGPADITPASERRGTGVGTGVAASTKHAVARIRSSSPTTGTATSIASYAPAAVAAVSSTSTTRASFGCKRGHAVAISATSPSDARATTSKLAVSKPVAIAASTGRAVTKKTASAALSSKQPHRSSLLSFHTGIAKLRGDGISHSWLSSIAVTAVSAHPYAVSCGFGYATCRRGASSNVRASSPGIGFMLSVRSKQIAIRGDTSGFGFAASKKSFAAPIRSPSTTRCRSSVLKGSVARLRGSGISRSVAAKQIDEKFAGVSARATGHGSFGCRRSSQMRLRNVSTTLTEMSAMHLGRAAALSAVESTASFDASRASSSNSMSTASHTGYLRCAAGFFSALKASAPAAGFYASRKQISGAIRISSSAHADAMASKYVASSLGAVAVGEAHFACEARLRRRFPARSAL